MEEGRCGGAVVVNVVVNMEEEERMARKSVKSITINPNVRCQRIYPVAGTKKVVEELQTVGFKMTGKQAIDLARVLLAVSQDWEEIDITCFRLQERKSDQTFAITVTSAI